MSGIRHFDLRRLDLNLLVAFDALAAERSVTRAAERLGLGQPAVSHALGRLRGLLGDPLFVPTPRGLVPTGRALALAPRVRAVLEGAQEMLLDEAARFDPAAWEGLVRIGLPDTLEMLLMPPLLAHLAAEAPGLQVMVRAVPDWHRGAELLDAGAVDLCLGIAGDPRPWHRRRTLWQDAFLSLFSPVRLGLGAPLSLGDFLAHPHVLAIPREGVLEGRTDQVLARIGRRRRIVLSTPHHLALPHLLLAAPLIATLHARPARFLAAAHDGLVTSPVPVEVPPIEEVMVWHEVADRDPAQRWFRDAVGVIAEGLGVGSGATPKLDQSNPSTG